MGGSARGYIFRNLEVKMPQHSAAKNITGRPHRRIAFRMPASQYELSLGLRMSWRKWVSLVALAGVLMHAAVIVRHNGIALFTALDALASADAVMAGTGVICGFAQDTDPANAPAGGADHPSKSTQNCPVCGGLAFAFGLPVVDGAALPVQELTGPRILVSNDTCVPALDRQLPSSRAPPVSV